MNPDVVVVSRPGKHFSIVGSDPSAGGDGKAQIIEEDGDADMEEDYVSADEGEGDVQMDAAQHTETPGSSNFLLPLSDPPSRFGSTIMTMDGPLI